MTCLVGPLKSVTSSRPVSSYSGATNLYLTEMNMSLLLAILKKVWVLYMYICPLFPHMRNRSPGRQQGSQPSVSVAVRLYLVARLKCCHTYLLNFGYAISPMIMGYNSESGVLVLMQACSMMVMKNIACRMSCKLLWV